MTLGAATIGAHLTHTSSQFLRGDEANLLPVIGGATVVGVVGSYALNRRTNLTARVTNLFWAEYASFGLLGEADDVLGDEFEDPQFLSPAAPRAAWIGVEFRIP